ncbi:MAG: hypothetical protein CK530_11930, partial [Planctomycetaceae bacterium]
SSSVFALGVTAGRTEDGEHHGAFRLDADATYWQQIDRVSSRLPCQPSNQTFDPITHKSAGVTAVLCPEKPREY